MESRRGSYVSAKISSEGFLSPNTMLCTLKTLFLWFRLPLNSCAHEHRHICIQSWKFLGHINVNNLTVRRTCHKTSSCQSTANLRKLTKEFALENCQWEVPQHSVAPNPFIGALGKDNCLTRVHGWEIAEQLPPCFRAWAFKASSAHPLAPAPVLEDACINFQLSHSSLLGLTCPTMSTPRGSYVLSFCAAYSFFLCPMRHFSMNAVPTKLSGRVKTWHQLIQHWTVSLPGWTALMDFCLLCRSEFLL